jgi:hypothetical protein
VSDARSDLSLDAPRVTRISHRDARGPPHSWKLPLVLPLVLVSGAPALSSQAEQRRAAGRLFIESGPDFPRPDGVNPLSPSGVIHAASESY